MAEEELETVTIRDNFYHDSFYKFVFVIASILAAIVALFALSIYLYLTPPPPINFQVYDEWRIQKEVPLNEPYLTLPSVLQWIGDVMPRMFIYDFVNYSTQLKNNNQYFTNDGWQVFVNQINNYASLPNVQTNKFFINATPQAAPYLINQGIVSGRYVWLVQMPISINFVGPNRSYSQTLTLQISIVRVSTLNNLDGVAIDNVMVMNNSSSNQMGT